MKSIDLNCDMGEVPDAIADGTQESLMPSLTSVNIACGGKTLNDTTRDPGVYRLTTAAGRVRYFVVRPDPREYDLTPADDANRRKLAAVGTGSGALIQCPMPAAVAARGGRGTLPRR